MPAFLYIIPLALGVTALALVIGTTVAFNEARMPEILRVLLLAGFVAALGSITVGVISFREVREGVVDLNQGIEDLNQDLQDPGN